jgi:glycosyltransferase involved in cell wall biosynthesis
VVLSLPTPPPGKTGWPWTENSALLNPTRQDGSEWPLISIVTPSFNQADFLEETIRSVLCQNYPNIELIIIDGGSSDGSLDIIRKYEPWIAYWISESDYGQSHAINKGFRRSTGRWVGWQNSDDTYSPESFIAVANADLLYPQADVLYGRTWLTSADNSGGYLASVHPCFSLHDMIPLPFVFNQSTFFNQRIFDRGLYLDPCKQHMMDYDFMWRLVLSGFQFQFVNDIVGCFRQQRQSKTSYQSNIGCSEFLDIYAYLYNHKNFPARLRPRVVSGWRSQIINDWAHDRYSELIDNTHRLTELAGWRTVSFGVASRYLASRFFCAQVQYLRRLYLNKRIRAEERRVGKECQRV